MARDRHHLLRRASFGRAACGTALLLFLFATCSWTSSAQERVRVAVLPLADKVSERLEPLTEMGERNAVYADALRMALEAGSHYQVAGAWTLRGLWQERQMRASEIDEAVAQRAGALLETDAVILVSSKPIPVVNLPAALRVEAKLLSVRTGETLVSADAEDPFGDGAARNKLAQELAGKLEQTAPTVVVAEVLSSSGGTVRLGGSAREQLKYGDVATVFPPAAAVAGSAAAGVQSSPLISEGDRLPPAVGRARIVDVGQTAVTAFVSGAVRPRVGDQLRFLLPAGERSEQKSAASPKEALEERMEHATGSMGLGLSPTPPDSAPAPGQAHAPSGRGARKELHRGARKSQSTEYAEGEELEAWRKTLKTGAVEYRVPATMTVTVPAVVTVQLHGIEDVQRSTLPEATGHELLQVSSYMKVELFAPMNPGEFAIQPDGDATRFVPNDGYETWSWTVKPDHAADAELLEVRISLVHKQGAGKMDEPVEDKTYSVRVRVQPIGTTVSQSFWRDPLAWLQAMLPGGKGWLALAALGGGVLACVRWWQKRATARKVASVSE
jgi:hypothetical protein